MSAMNVFSILGLSLLCGTVAAAPAWNNNVQDQSGVKKIYDRVEMLRHEVSNHEAQLKSLEDRLRNGEDTIAALRGEIDTSSKAHKDSIKGRSEGFESKISTHDSTIKGLATDLRQLQTHANQSSSVLEQYQKRIADLEKIVDKQAQNIDSLKTAMRSLMQALKGDAGAIAESETGSDGNTLYRVQSGDSLGHIAQKFHTTVRELKEANSLKNNTIIVGQKLRIPGNGTQK